MKTSLISGLNDLQRSEIISEYQGSQLLRRRLTELLEARQKKCLDKRRKEDAYDSPNWGFLQADSIGYERALNEVIQLIS